MKKQDNRQVDAWTETEALVVTGSVVAACWEAVDESAAAGSVKTAVGENLGLSEGLKGDFL